ncbi:hypothetical protein A8A01_03305 [Ewingella americana]|nr:hypothetical protein A8A01_03305 [Ewingella americana]
MQETARTHLKLKALIKQNREPQSAHERQLNTPPEPSPMRLTNTLTGETFLVSRMAKQYEYQISEVGTRNRVRMNHEQYAAYLRKPEIEEIEHDS